MNDQDYLENYLNEEDTKPEETKEDNILDSLKPSGNVVEFPKNPPVTIQKPPKVEEIIEQHKKQPNLIGKGVKVKKNTEKVLGAAVPSLDDFPVPSGGIGLLLFISLLVVFAITPVNGGSGMTRLQLLWQAVLGNYTLNGNGAGATHTSATPQVTNYTPVSTIPDLSSFMQGGMTL